MKTHRRNQEIIIFFSLFLLAFFILFFISPDSYFSSPHNRIDSAWFFMCGKAWMNGLVPYVDFADSKGPLLWLIYGIGYLLSHTSYVGIYWISCLWYGLTFFFTYKTARIFLPETGKSILCTVLMSLAFFNPWFHNEIRAEDFCMLFMMLSLYEVCLLVWTDHPKQDKCYFILGCCFSALLLIKFNIAAMQAILVMASLIASKKGLIWKKMAFCMLGGLVVVLPFLVYFILQGNLSAFIQEYFLNTLKVTSSFYSGHSSELLGRAAATGSTLLVYLCEWTCIFDTPQIGALLLLIVLGGFLFSQQLKDNKFLILIVSFVTFALSVRHYLLHYFNICSPFLLFLAISSLRNAPSIKRLPLTAYLSVIVCSCILIHIFCFNYPILFSRNSRAKEGYMEMAHVIAQVDHPTLVNAFDNETGIGTLGEALPAGKYWARQAGSTGQVDAEHKSLILSGKADFVFVPRPEITQERGLQIEDIIEAGYHIVSVGGERGNSILLARNGSL